MAVPTSDDETVIPLELVLGAVGRNVQADIDLMLAEFERAYAPEGDNEGKLVIAVLRQAARPS